ncbi:ribonuclease toxin HepT-like protein [Candidatus Contubernalis alkaliaceticus]|uniref:ribonuclease toxin HepT-like protein n=1 Tax=Candidatus Contubernalis alkaliaceticus TaxID=338645 RepID=UPI001F4C338A|nr:hypothetical protein [Candidatus Contubernalis alkalaceticus]UNC93521.1 hypothetical protein HUE98_16405 [Candidatus Contubernalis alkalaceticus]
MKRRLAVLRDEIDEELRQIYHLRNELKQISNEKMLKSINLKTRVYASIISDFFMASERIFKLIAKEIDEELPESDDWHKKLLRQMSVEIPEIRPAVIDKKLYFLLEEYLKFRHLVRNIYGFQLNYERFAHLIIDIDTAVSEMVKQINSFLIKMDEIAKKI